jgi:hypothetical protein
MRTVLCKKPIIDLNSLVQLSLDYGRLVELQTAMINMEPHEQLSDVQLARAWKHLSRACDELDRVERIYNAAISEMEDRLKK